MAKTWVTHEGVRIPVSDDTAAICDAITSASDAQVRLLTAILGALAEPVGDGTERSRLVWGSAGGSAAQEEGR